MTELIIYDELALRPTPNACEICGYSGADHQKPNGKWIHRGCGLAQWAREVARENKKVNAR